MARKRKTTIIVPVEPMLLTIPQTAQSMSLGRTKVYDLINNAGLPTIKLGSSIRVPLSSLKQWLEQRERQGHSA